MSSIRESKEDWFREAKEYPAQCIIGRDEANPGKLQVLSPAQVAAMLGVSGTSWGSITGTLSAQTDLQDALDDKADVSSLAAVALSGDYLDLINTPTIITAHSALSGLSSDDHTQYHTDARALTWLGTRSTSDLPEGSRLYFTDERVDDRVASLIQNGTGITWSYNDAGNTLTPTVTITQYTDELAQDAVGNILTDSSTIDFTYNDAGNSITAAIIANSISNSLLRTSAGLSIIGRSANTTGNVADITAGTDNQVLRRSGTTLDFGALNLASSAAVTGDLPLANIAQFGANTVATNPTAGTADLSSTSLSGSSVLGRGSSGNITGLASGGHIIFTATTFDVDLTSKYNWTGNHSWGASSLFTLYNPAGSFTYSIVRSAIAGNCNVTLPLLTGNDTFVFEGHTQTLTNKTLTSPVLNTSLSGTAFLDEDDFVSNSANKTISQQSARVFVENGTEFKNAVSGRYYGPRGTAQFSGTAALINDWTFFAPFIWGEAFTLDKVSMEVTTAAAGNARIGIWADASGAPGTLIRNCGTVDTSTTGVKEITGLAQAMPRGRFWLGFQTNAIIAVRSFGTVIGHDFNCELGVPAFGNALVLMADVFSTYAGGLPNPPTVTQFNGADTPMMYWRL